MTTISNEVLNMWIISLLTVDYTVNYHRRSEHHITTDYMPNGVTICFSNIRLIN